MMNRSWVVLVTAVLAIAIATWLLGWWGVPLMAFVIGVLYRRRPAIPWTSALAAMIAWMLLLEINAIGGRLNVLTRTLSGVMHESSAVLIIVTLLFAALLAWGAGVLGAEIGRAFGRVGEEQD